MMEDLISLYERIDEEINDAREYADEAICCRDRSPATAQAYLKLSADELQHAQVLQGLSVQQKKERLTSEEAQTLMGWIRSCQDSRMKEVVRLHEEFQNGK